MELLGLNLLDKDWYGAKVPGSPQWTLWIEDGLLVMKGVVNALPVCIQKDSEGAFVEGLWEGDVIELFLHNTRTGFYIEFNLGPRGSWWCCTFDSPRKRTPGGPKPLAGVQTSAALSESAWHSTLAVPIASLPPELAFDPGVTTGNITFCLGTPQQYIMLADIGGGEPDFHRPDKWIVLNDILYNKNNR